MTLDKPEIPESWLVYFDPKRLRKLKDALISLQLIDEHTALRARYVPYWDTRMANNMAWRELESLHEAALLEVGYQRSESIPTIEEEPDYLQGLDFRRDVLWVYQTMGAKNVRQSSAPSPGAWPLRQWAQEYRTKFFDSFLPKAMRGQEDEILERDRAEVKRVEEVREILKELLEEAANREVAL